MNGGDAPRWRRYLRFLRPDPVSDVDDELAFHLEMRVERSMSMGMTPEAARRDALRRFGDLSRWRAELVDHDTRKHASRERQRIMSDFVRDVQYALRSLRRAPGMTIAIVLTLALGLGVNMAMFSFLDVVFLRPPAGVRAPEQVRRVWTEENFRSGRQYWSGFSHPQYVAVRDALTDAAATTIYRQPEDLWLRRGDAEIRTAVSYAASSFFGLLGVRPALGRFFTADEDRLGVGERVAVVSHAFWEQRLDGDPAVIGSRILLNSRPFVIVGVAAKEFSGVELDVTDVWVPLASHPNRGATPWWQGHAVNGFQILLRQRQGASIADRTIVERIATGLLRPEAMTWPGDTTKVVALGSIIRAQGPGKKVAEVTMATRLAGVTIIVLLIACANVVNLLLARAMRRRREIAVRLAMGIPRFRLARLLLTESVLLAIGAALAAVLAATWGGVLLRTLLMPEVNWADHASPFHWRVLAGAIALALAAGVIAGLVPALQAARTSVTGALKTGDTGASGDQGGRSRVRHGLIVAQASLSMVLLVGAALFISSLRNVRGLRTGYDTSRLVYAQVDFDTRDSQRDAMFPRAFRELAGRMREAPGVEDVALARMVPTRGFSMASFHPDVDTTAFRKPFATFTLVSAEFFSVTGMRILRGQGFPTAGTGSTPPVVVINEAFARAQWPGMEAIGRCLRFPPDDVCYRVVGIAETAMFDKLIEEPQPQYYLPLDNPPAQAGTWFGTMILKTEAHSRAMVISQLQRALRETFPAGRPAITTMDKVMEPEYRPWRLGATLFTSFGVLAVVVAALGIYSTIAYTVTQRAHEFGVRTALGARSSDILRHVIGGSMRVVAVGVAVGVVLALATGRFVAALLYGIEPSHPGVILGVAIMLLVIAVAAAVGPAWRAARVNPVVALRAE